MKAKIQTMNVPGLQITQRTLIIKISIQVQHDNELMLIE